MTPPTITMIRVTPPDGREPYVELTLNSDPPKKVTFTQQQVPMLIHAFARAAFQWVWQ